jgi:hypothetical protein
MGGVRRGLSHRTLWVKCRGSITTHGSLEMFACQIIYYIVLDSNDFDAVSGRKERIRARSGAQTPVLDAQRTAAEREENPYLAQPARMRRPASLLFRFAGCLVEYCCCKNFAIS